MSQEQFTQTDWRDRVSQCLQELVDYERWLESELSRPRQLAEVTLGVIELGVRAIHDDRDSRVRDRIAGYWAFLMGAPRGSSKYQRTVYERLNTLRDVLLEHPVLNAAVYRDERGLLALGLNLATSRSAGYQLNSMLMGLVDHAVENTPEATASALAQFVQRGEDEDLSSNYMLLFRGLHVERRHDFPNGLSIIPFKEVQRYMPDDRIRFMLETGDSETNREPIAAVILETKWGPLIVQAGFDMEGMGWPETPWTFRDDALLVLSALAVSHGMPVVGARTHTTAVEHQIEHLMGREILISRFDRDVNGVSTMRIEPVATPAISKEKLAECEQLLLGCRDDVRLRLALSRLASSLARTGMHEAFDRVLDAAIALEVMYRLDVSRGKGSQLACRARNLIGGDQDDRKWIGRAAKSIYAARNDIIHDGTLVADVNRIHEDAFELGRRTLLHVARSGHPVYPVRSKGAKSAVAKSTG